MVCAAEVMADASSSLSVCQAVPHTRPHFSAHGRKLTMKVDPRWVCEMQDQLQDSSFITRHRMLAAPQALCRCRGHSIDTTVRTLARVVLTF